MKHLKRRPNLHTVSGNQTVEQVKLSPNRAADPFDSSTPGERIWPRYPRGIDARADHRQARKYVDEGVLSPTSRWQLSDAA